ncbi:acyl-CoA dehydrogenase family protein [Acidicapsa ligni]|uniref:acyl-CoA dehydrogenase family protein n=1 Tax=Acidicapsa ligni TaxID=542300 RepID=UPI0021DF4C9B|nr:acyl-CoA dehydrogenase family protein [Acidicapsa ligni]
MATTTPTKAHDEQKPAKVLPAPNVDFYAILDTLPAEDVAVVKQVRTFMETKVAPIITKHWVEDSFPFEILQEFKDLNIGGVAMNGYGCRGGSALLFGLIAMEMARFDSSIATFFGVHNGLAMGSIYLGGSEEQKQKWLPSMARWEKIGCFGLTEPLVGSGASGGLTTTAKREGDTWVLNGQKKWIGNSPWCDISIIWARDVADNQVKAFIVENKTTPGFSVEKIENKIALKVVQNGLITMDNCRVSEENRLQGDASFHDTARVLKMTRFMVGWEATGCAMGAYENALKYCQERTQFGKPIGSFQLVQDLLSKMLANITASQCLVVRMAQLHAEDKLTDAHAALAKAFTTAKCRETVAWARELLGGNGIVADYNVGRFFADAEALYSYEGTYQMQNLILGKAITGFSAFL